MDFSLGRVTLLTSSLVANLAHQYLDLQRAAGRQVEREQADASCTTNSETGCEIYPSLWTFLRVIVAVHDNSIVGFAAHSAVVEFSKEAGWAKHA